jgi:hypothetical protein
MLSFTACTNTEVNAEESAFDWIGTFDVLSGCAWEEGDCPGI